LLKASCFIWRVGPTGESDPELLKQCAIFSSAAGRLKRETRTKPRDEWDLDCLDALEEASDSITIIGTPKIEDAVDRLIGYVPLVLYPEQFPNESADEARKSIFDSHRIFIDAVREYFQKPPKVYKAVPMIQRPRSPGSKPVQAD
jgi:hypothetical protein